MVSKHPWLWGGRDYTWRERHVWSVSTLGCGVGGLHIAKEVYMVNLELWGGRKACIVSKHPKLFFWGGIYINRKACVISKQPELLEPKVLTPVV